MTTITEIKVNPALITYQVEPFSTFFEDAQELLKEHWHEIALDQDRIHLDIDKARYGELSEKGILHIVTVRDANYQRWSWDPGKLVGYHASMIIPHLHYKTTLHALTDVFFVHPDYRKGRIGINLFKYVESSLRDKGVVKIISSVKRHKDIGAIFEHLGWTEIERVFSKVIG